MQNNQKKKGFTLIELIVVIAILGILAAIAVPRLSGFQNSAKVSADITTFGLVDKSVAMGAADTSLGAGTVVMTVTNGTGVFTGTATSSDANTAAAMAKLMGTPIFKLPANISATAKTATWTIASDGSVSVDKPIGATTGILQ